jgi:hypothetical protein
MSWLGHVDDPKYLRSQRIRALCAAEDAKKSRAKEATKEHFLIQGKK